MPFNPEWRSLVPGGAQVDRLQDELVRGEFARASDELRDAGNPEEDVTALSWVFRLAQEPAVLDRIASTVPWLDRIAVGFFDPEVDRAEPGFGLVAYSSLDPALVQSDEVSDPRLLGIDLGAEVDGTYIRAVVRLGYREPHVSVTSPSVAETTTWAKSTRLNREGWLLPYHAVDIGAPVHFSDGSSGSVIENWGDCIDAVLVSSSSPPARGAVVKCLRGVSPGAAVAVTDQHGSMHNNTIVDVDVNLGVVRHQLFPIRFAYDWNSSSKGDSGALVAADPCMEPMGMHQGAVNVLDSNGNNVTYAYALCLYQLEDHGGLEVHQ